MNPVYYFQHILNRNIFMKYNFLILSAIMTFSLLAAPVKKHRPVLEVNFAENVPFSTDFSNPVWKKTPAYPFMKAVNDLSDFHALPLEGGQIRLLYDKNFLYLAAELEDSEVTTTGTKNQSAFFALGDVVEVFLKPENHNFYWEIYGTPNNLQTCYFFPSRGSLGLPSGFNNQGVEIKVVSSVNGSFNNSLDRDNGWKTLIKIPLASLRKNNLKFVPGEKWTIFVARYNYSRYLPSCELSGVPQKFGDFHVLSDYARLVIK